jgi:hypothetical protein
VTRPNSLDLGSCHQNSTFHPEPAPSFGKMDSYRRFWGAFDGIEEAYPRQSTGKIRGGLIAFLIKRNIECWT